MSIMKPGLGDLIDRLFILKRKQIDNQEEPNDVSFDVEEKLVQVALKVFVNDKQGEQLISSVELCAINATMWQRTDEARDGETITNHHKELAYSLLTLNDVRHDKVNHLNKPAEEVPF